MCPENLIPVPLSSLRLDTIADFDIHYQAGDDHSPVLFREKNLPVTKEALGRLADHAHIKVFVRADESPLYRRYVETNLPTILADDSVEIGERTETLYQCAQGLMAEVMEEPRAGERVKRCKDLVKNTLDFMRREQTSFGHLLRVVSYDYYTYTHSVNVFVFSVALAQHVGHRDEKTLQSFGEGALLHDVGKSRIDSSIVNCRGKLSPEQWQIMRLHPVFGHDLLASQGGVDDIALDVVRHHHEKLAGHGYPDHLKGRSISEFSRIVSVADIFDALTTRRSYKSALNSFPALSLMKDEMIADLDGDIFRAFVEMMGSPKPGALNT